MIIHKLFCGLCDAYRDANPEEIGVGREPMQYVCHKCHQPMQIADSSIMCDHCMLRVPFRDSEGWTQLSQSLSTKDKNNWSERPAIICVHFCTPDHYALYLNTVAQLARGLADRLSPAPAPKLQILEGEVVD